MSRRSKRRRRHRRQGPGFDPIKQREPSLTPSVKTLRRRAKKRMRKIKKEQRRKEHEKTVTASKPVDSKERRRRNGALGAAMGAFYRRMGRVEICPMTGSCPRPHCKSTEHFCMIGGRLTDEHGLECVIRGCLRKIAQPWYAKLIPASVSARRFLARLCQTHRQLAMPITQRLLKEVEAGAFDWPHDLYVCARRKETDDFEEVW
jgi:hypothetical protein